MEKFLFGLPRVPVLDKTIKLYHEDNFANVPEITMVWPVPQSYQKDAYALDFLAKILADGKKAPLYKVLVKEKKLTSRTTAYNRLGRACRRVYNHHQGK